MRYSDNFLRDVRFYLGNRHRFTFFGGIVQAPLFDRTGVSGVEAFWLFDTTGRHVPTKHPRLFVALMRTKKSINWHIKAWADGFWDMCEQISFYLNEIVNCPTWVESALRGAIIRADKKRHENRTNEEMPLMLFNP